MSEKGQIPPGPRGDLLLGNTLDFKDRPLHFMRYAAQAYGDTTRFKVGPMYWYLITHPDDVWAAMVTRADSFQKPAIAKRLWDQFLGDGLLTTEGDDWKRQHKLVSPAFRRGRIAEYGKEMVAYTNNMLDQWPDGTSIDLDNQMVNLTLQVVAKTLFDADVHKDAQVFGQAMEVLQNVMVEHIHMPVPIPRWWPSERNRRKLKALADIEGIVKQVIDERRKSKEDRGDLLSMLLLARDENGDGLSDKEVRDQSMTLFFAGHETTAHAMTWAWYLLADHPHITARLQAELDQVTGGDTLRVEHLTQLPYLEQTIKEALRFLPSVWIFMKEPVEDIVLRGFKIPKGAPVAISPYITHHDPRWYPSPETFNPDRFAPEKEQLLPKGAYFPFSGGARICLGKHFAMMEMRLIIGTMLQRLNPAVSADYRLKLKAELSLHPDGPLPINIHFRTREHRRLAM